ncbi:hypothetical protein MSAN_01564400 [Mycena sanguinolenta]|uniref:Uncharacterized protein n=1 Tax=Mycena sanguinolenta TaxID=230812 RepID=A0A8H6Y2Q8_9AGAR|nr:hypothetical protein MSAN_01564400 [Mycena sanguinolenta]
MSTLPSELELQIFQLVARGSPYDAALRLRLMLVARRVQIWVEPFVYHCVAFSKVNNWDRLRRIVATKPRDFLARHVKSLCMPPKTVTLEEASEILLACTGVQRLAWWIDSFSDAPAAIPQTVQTLALCRLSMELAHFFCFAADLPNIHAHLTHLELIFCEEYTSAYPGTLDLACFPYLTHLALRSDSVRLYWPLDLVSSMLHSCGSLQILVLLDHVFGVAETVIRRPLNDPRAVLVITQDTLYDWEPSARPLPKRELLLGKGDMWERGEDVLRGNLHS